MSRDRSAHSGRPEVGQPIPGAQRSVSPSRGAQRLLMAEAPTGCQGIDHKREPTPTRKAGAGRQMSKPTKGQAVTTSTGTWAVTASVSFTATVWVPTDLIGLADEMARLSSSGPPAFLMALATSLGVTAP